MKTTVVHLEGIESILSTAGVEKKMCQHPGIHKVETNFMTGKATAYHDESVMLAAIKQCVADYGSQYTGERLKVILITTLSNRAPIGWLKAVPDARPAGSDDIHKIYPESFRGAYDLQRIYQEAQAIVSDTLAVPSGKDRDVRS